MSEQETVAASSKSDPTVIARAMAFPMESVIQRYAADQKLPMSVAAEHEIELKRFLSLCAMNRSASYGMAGPVDELWHTFIIFTREYAQFCRSVAGHFIHHVPTTLNTRADSKGYQDFLDTYILVFGEEPPRHIWPRLGASRHQDGADCSESGCGRCSKCQNCAKADCDAGCKACEGCGQGA